MINSEEQLEDELDQFLSHSRRHEDLYLWCRFAVVFLLTVFAILALSTEIIDVAKAYFHYDMSPKMALLIISLFPMSLIVSLRLWEQTKSLPKMLYIFFFMTTFFLCAESPIDFELIFYETDGAGKTFRVFNTIFIVLSIVGNALWIAELDRNKTVERLEEKSNHTVAKDEEDSQTGNNFMGGAETSNE